MGDIQNKGISVDTSKEEQTNSDKLKNETGESDEDFSRNWNVKLLHLNSTPLTEPPDILVAILFLIFTDNDFIPVYDKEQKQHEVPSFNRLYNLPRDWKTATPGKYSFKFYLPECFDFSCHFVGAVVGELLLVNAICTYPDVVNSVCLNISHYVSFQKDTTSIHKAKTLLYLFKDKIVTPSRSAAFAYRGIPNSSLTGLPKEIFEYVLVLCGPNAVCKLMCTSRLLRSLARDQLVWHTFYLQEFESFTSNSVDDDAHDWYERYRDAFIAKVEVERKSVFLRNFRKNRVVLL